MHGDTNVDLHRQTETIAAINAAFKKEDALNRLCALHGAMLGHRFYTLSPLNKPHTNPDFYAPLFDRETIRDYIDPILCASAAIIAPQPDQRKFFRGDVDFALHILTLFINSLPKFPHGPLGSDCPGIHRAIHCADEYIVSYSNKPPQPGSPKTLIHSFCHALTNVTGGVVTGKNFVALPTGEIKFKPTANDEFAVLRRSFHDSDYGPSWTTVPFARETMQHLLGAPYAKDHGPTY